MVTPLRPAVYIDETDRTAQPIPGAGTAVTGLMGIAEKGPVRIPQRVFSLDDFRRIFGRKLRVSDRWIALYADRGPAGCARLGISASRRLGNAVHLDGRH